MEPTPQHYEPIPGESTLPIYWNMAMLGMGIIGLILALVFRAGAPTIQAAAVVTFVGLVGTIYLIRQRARYLEQIRTGQVIERKPWTGPDLPYTG